MLRLSLLDQFVFLGDSEFPFVVVRYSFGINSLLQEDGSVPDRDQVQTNFFFRCWYSLYFWYLKLYS